MLEMLEFCTPQLEVMKASEHVQQFMLPDCIKQEQEWIYTETLELMQEKLKETPQLTQHLFGLYQGCHRRDDEAKGKSLKFQYTEFLIELHQFVACAQAAKMAKSGLDFQDKCQQEAKDTKATEKAWNRVLENDKIFKAGLPQMVQHIEGLRKKCEAK